MAFFIIGFIAALVFVVYFSIKSRKINDQEHFKAKDYFVFSKFKNCLQIKKRDAFAYAVLSVEESRNINVSYTPDKLVYTGATVGGITTGGVHVQKGGYTMQVGAKNGRYYISYKYGDFVDSKPVSAYVGCLELSDTDFEIAMHDSTLKKYISPEKKNYINLVSVTLEDARYIIAWIANDK